jgi:hypothetical protein
VPLTPRGTLALRLGLHRSWKEALPRQMIRPLKQLRRRWYDLRSQMDNERTNVMVK